MRMIRFTICLAALLAVLAIPAAAASEIRTITGFPAVEEGRQALSVLEACGETEEELLERMPESLEVYLDGGERPVSIPVSWVCAEGEHSAENRYYCQFVPQWDDTRWELAEGLDLLADVPYVGVRWKESDRITLESVTGKANETTIYWYLKEELGLNTAAVCGILVNIYGESSYEPANLQNTYEKVLGYTDKTYTEAVDNGSYTNFVRDAAGYGLCQWTFWSRKQGLLELAQRKGTSIGDLEMQLEYMAGEMSSKIKRYLRNVENTAQGAYDAAHYFCTYYEQPANTAKVAVIRGNLAKNTYWPEYQPEVLVRLDACGGTVDPEYLVLNCGELYGELPVPARDGYTFLGWSTEPDGTDCVSEETLLTTEEEHTLYALWEEGVTVTFDACGGSVALAEKRVFLGEPYGELPVPELEGKVFLGWGTSPDAAEFCAAETPVSDTGAHTLYAVWHTHALTCREAEEADCMEPGKREHWACEGCGRAFADAEGMQALGREELFLPALGHAFRKGVCSRCGQEATLTLRCGALAVRDGSIVITACLQNPGEENVPGTLCAALYEKGRLTSCGAVQNGVALPGQETEIEISLPALGDWTGEISVRLFFLDLDSWQPLTNAAVALALEA